MMVRRTARILGTKAVYQHFTLLLYYLAHELLPTLPTLMVHYLRDKLQSNGVAIGPGSKQKVASCVVANG